MESKKKKTRLEIPVARNNRRLRKEIHNHLNECVNSFIPTRLDSWAVHSSYWCSVSNCELMSCQTASVFSLNGSFKSWLVLSILSRHLEKKSHPSTSKWKQWMTYPVSCLHLTCIPLSRCLASLMTLICVGSFYRYCPHSFPAWDYSLESL